MALNPNTIMVNPDHYAALLSATYDQAQSVLREVELSDAKPKNARGKFSVPWRDHQMRKYDYLMTHWQQGFANLHTSEANNE